MSDKQSQTPQLIVAGAMALAVLTFAVVYPIQMTLLVAFMVLVVIGAVGLWMFVDWFK